MNRTTHIVRTCFTDMGNVHAAVTLPAVPGVTVTSDRSDTAPRTKTIRCKVKRQPCKVTPYAMVKAALIDIAEGRV